MSDVGVEHSAASAWQRRLAALLCLGVVASLLAHGHRTPCQSRVGDFKPAGRSDTNVCSEQVRTRTTRRGRRLHMNDKSKGSINAGKTGINISSTVRSSSLVRAALEGQRLQM